ncbi:MAG: NAD(P)H-binding protein [Pseudomonadales bacterium]|nr:NAD(P)H-binding protein [Pseudomonadales bacterium]
MTARIWLAGATGYIGRALAKELVARGHAVTALVRPGALERVDDLTRAALASCRLVEAELTEAGLREAGLAHEPVDAVFSCIASRTGVSEDAWRVDHGANVALLSAAQTAGARQFVLLSAICVQRPQLAFQHAKLAFEAALQASGMAFSIVRPTAFFKSLAGQVERVKAGKPFLVFGDGALTACKPISEGDLARYLADCLDDPARTNRILPIGGPGPAITPREQGEMLARVLGVEPTIRSVPVGLFTFIGALLAPLALVSRRMAEKAELARIGRFYATESMLLWNEAAQAFDAEGTPETGTETLEQFYERVASEGLAGQELGAAKVF